MSPKMALNETLRFEDVDSAVKRAFLRTPERVLLSSGTGLYKWTDRPLVNANRISPWWSFLESRLLPSGTMAEGFRVSEERAARLKRPHREFTRARAAISVGSATR
jgi:hypothetical protein